MKFIWNMKVSRKLMVAFLIVVLLVGVVGLIGIRDIKKVDSNNIDQYEKMTVPASLMAQISTSFHKMSVNIRQTIIYEDLSDKQREAGYAREQLSEIASLSKEFGELIESETLLELYGDFEETFIELEPLVLNVLEQADQGNDSVVWSKVQAGSTMGNVSIKIQNTIDSLNYQLIEEGKTTVDNNTSITRNAVTEMIIFNVIAILVAIALASFLSKQISVPLLLLINAAKKMAVGDVNVNINQKSQDEIGQLMGAFSDMVDNIKNQSENAVEISKGNLDIQIELKSDKDVLAEGMKTVVKVLNDVVNESAMLTHAAMEGQLKIRNDITKYHGGYKQIVRGMNETFDALYRPLKITSDCIAKISHGEIPEKITETVNGDFNILKGNLNQCIDAVNLLIDDAENLVEAAISGKLKTRADASKHQGDFQKIIQGVNDTLDATIKPVEETADVLAEMAKGNMKARVTGNYQGDHADIKDALNFMGENIGDYLDEIAENLSKMANKDFTNTISREYLGDFILLKDSINHIDDQFNEVLQEINAASEQVEAAADQVATSSQALSQGSAEQASSVEEISSSMTEVAEQTKQNAVNANEANVLSNNAKTDATKGNTQMADMLVAMNEIKDSSKNIANIIKVIDDIAFQTNILALNAAVEAARAGEHGKGFAVVAEEVRNLAARSASAAKETTELIDNSIDKVNEGYEIANNTAAALNEIVGGVSNAVDIVGMIADASNEQASAITQINEGVEQISQVTQTNMATAEESASASEELASHAQLLKQLIDEFKLKGSGNMKKALPTAVNRNLIKKNNFSREAEISLEDDDFGKY
jgi:methyl-accepting chemotaxis protein